MNCPVCNQELSEKDFLNLSLQTLCPNCQTRLVFNPNFVPLVLFMAFSYLLWDYLPQFSNFLYSFIVGFVLVFITMILVLRLMLKFKLGKIKEYQERLR